MAGKAGLPAHLPHLADLDGLPPAGCQIAGQVFNWPTVDNSFAFALFQFGPVVAALLGILFAAALLGHAKQGRRVEVCCLFAMLAYAYMEVQPFHLTTNPTALLLCGAVFAQTSARWQKIE